MIELPKELTAILDDIDFEDGGVEIVAIELQGDVLNLKIELWDDFDNFPRQQWKIECKGVKSYKFQPSQSVGIEIKTDHPLLYPYNSVQSELYFNGSTDKLKELLADIVCAHNQVLGEWFSLKDFVHQIPCISDVSYIKSNDFKYGLFAKGADKLMKEYLKVMEQYEISANISNQHNPKYWDGSSWVESANDNVVLFIGEDYVITNSIQVTKV